MSTRSDVNYLKRLTYGRQCLDEADARAVLEVLNGGWLTQGPIVDRFEAALSDQLGVRHAIVCNNGTTALHLATAALGWGPGDVVLVPAITFLAGANCSAYVGAEPYFVDIDDQSQTIDLNAAEHAIKQLTAAGRRVRGIVAVDLAGHPCDWNGLRAIADRHGLDLVDDACHSLGASYDGLKIGGCDQCEITTLSFHPVKHITTGEGGAVLTNDDAIAARVRRLRSHGTVRGTEMVDSDGPWAYDMIELGFNYRLTDLQCALGLSQLEKLPQFVDRRRAIAARYTEAFAGTVVRTPVERAGVRHAYHLYTARLPFDQLGLSRVQLFDRCREQELLLQVHYRPLYMNTYYRQQPMHHDAAQRAPVSNRYYSETVSLPMYPDLSDSDVQRVVETVLGAVRSA